MGGDSCFEGGEFESQHHILDGQWLHKFVRKDENKRKRGRGWAI